MNAKSHLTRVSAMLNLHITHEKQYIRCVVLCLFMCSCGENSTTDNKNLDNRTISLTEAVTNRQEIRLSEIADSITFIPLETTDTSIMGKHYNFLFSPDYIFSENYYFDWNGKFGNRIGRTGHGPDEEVSYQSILFQNDHFYSMGGKLIEYEKNGRFTGKRAYITELRPSGDKDRKLIMNAIDLAKTGEGLMLYDYPDSVYFLNTDLKVIAARAVLKADSLPEYRDRITNRYTRFTSDYKGKTLFYNFFNDTLFYATGNSLEPKWIVRFSDELRIPLSYLLRFSEYKLVALEKFFFEEKMDDTDYIRLSDKRHYVMAAHESDRYLFFLMCKVAWAAEYRGVPSPNPYVVYYDKATGKTVGTQEQGFTDDLTGLGMFLPKWGVYNEQMISSIEPYQLHDLVDQAQAAGETVNPRLIALAKQVKPDDNPILIVAHLKK